MAALNEAGAEGSWSVRPGVVRGYFGALAPAPAAAFRAAWRALGGDDPPPRATLRAVPPTDWIATFRAAARPVAATPRLWVAPPGTEIPAGAPPDAVVVRIEPGTGFGTGGHATTRALLAWLDGTRGFATALDVGTGSGVLAIAAAQLGARLAVGLDVDRAALDNAAGNRARNAGGERVALVAGSLDAVRSGARFDRVLANLDAATLARLLPALAARTALGGRLGVAGLLAGERGDFLARAAACGLAPVDEREEADPALGDVWWSAWLAAAQDRPVGRRRDRA